MEGKVIGLQETFDNNYTKYNPNKVKKMYKIELQIKLNEINSEERGQLIKFITYKKQWQ